MPDLAPMRLPDSVASVAIDPPVPCPVCGTEVSRAEATVTVSTTPGERHFNAIDLHVRVETVTVTAAECGHVIHERREDDDG